MINYWHNNLPQGGPFLALVHAMMAVRDLPAAQKDAWRVWFDHFVFDAHASDAAAHLAPAAQGINGPASAQRSEMIRRFVIQILSAE